jgi:hypothetical protein
MFNISSQQMQCAAATMVNATDSFGSYTALKVQHWLVVLITEYTLLLDI